MISLDRKSKKKDNLLKIKLTNKTKYSRDQFSFCFAKLKLVGPLGLEPRTYGLKDRYSNQLS